MNNFFYHFRHKDTPWLHNGTWTIGATLTNTPTAGSEMLTNGDLETWSSATNAGTWVEGIGGSSTVNREGTTVHGGSFAARLDVDSSNTSVFINQPTTASTGDWVAITAWIRSSASGKTARMDLGTVNGVARDPGTTYTQFSQITRAVANNPNATLTRASATSASIYYDDASAKKLTLNTLFALKALYVNPAQVGATGTIVAGNWCGVAYGWDSYIAPTTGLLAIHDGVSTCQLLKCVSGIWTQLLSQSVAYSSGVLPQIKWTGGTTYQLFYSDTQRGTDQTVSDAGTGIYHGVFNPYSGNTITGFSVS